VEKMFNKVRRCFSKNGKYILGYYKKKELEIMARKYIIILKYGYKLGE